MDAGINHNDGHPFGALYEALDRVLPSTESFPERQRTRVPDDEMPRLSLLQAFQDTVV
jgi:hypothetical protein